ncbi:TonB family protein [Oceanobacter antarcticus]|uniref:TonB family protein n=1 Tax=Oceanobacter antarcticus TaxID=3133425 RepID=A0ABW8NLQ3_9GAMM
MRLITLFLVVLLSVTAVEAAALELQGAAVYRRLDNDVYLASVYSDSANSEAWLNSAQPLRLEMRILADELSPRRFYRLWNEGLAINLSEAEMNRRVTQVTRFMHLLKDDLLMGDQLVISNETGETRVTINAVDVLQLDDPGFVRALVTVWVGKYPRSQKFKDDLIHMSADQRAEQQARLLAIEPAAGRQQVIESWVTVEQHNSAKPSVSAAAVVIAGQGSAAGVTAAGVTVAAVTLPPAATEPSPDIMAPAESQPEPGMEMMNIPELDETPLSALSDPVAEALSTNQQQETLRLAEEQAAAELAARQAQQRKQEALLIERQQSEARYYRDLLTSANAKVLYPKQALRRGLEGTARVALKLNRDGSLITAVISETSGHTVLDSAAVRAAERAAPYRELPGILLGPDFEFDIPFRFVMNTR